MAKFRKQPVVIDAAQFDGEQILELDKLAQPLRDRGAPWWVPQIQTFAPETPGELIKALAPGHIYRVEGGHGIYIVTLEGDHLANPGDFIIRGIAGELYPCKPEIFFQTYAAVED